MADKKVSDLVEDPAPTENDLLLITDIESGQSKRVKASNIYKGFLKKSIDTNGWTVYDYGAWKEYEKKSSGAAGGSGAGQIANIFTGQNFPVGLSPSSCNWLHSFVSNAGAGQVTAYPEYDPASAVTTTTYSVHGYRHYGSAVQNFTMTVTGKSV